MSSAIAVACLSPPPLLQVLRSAIGHATCPSTPLPPPVAVVALVHSFISQAAACCAPRIPNAAALHPCSCLTKQACASDTLIQRVDHANASVHTALPQNEPVLHHSASCCKMARDLVRSNCISDFRLPLCVCRRQRMQTHHVGSRSICSPCHCGPPHGCNLLHMLPVPLWSTARLQLTVGSIFTRTLSGAHKP
jgi:hypothetical protein